MHIKFLKPKSPAAQAAINYVLRDGKKPEADEEKVTVLRGNPQRVAALADSLDYKNKYSSAVIAWHKDDAPTPDQITEVLNDFEKLAFAALDPQQYTYCAIEHAEKDGSKHLHIIVPRCDMINDTSLNIAPPGSRKSFDALRDLHNAKNGWKSPDIEANPQNARTIQLGKNRGTRKKLMLAIDTFVTESILAGHITNRETLLTELEEAGRELGLEITNTGKKYITIKTAEMKKGMRLKGAIYEHNFELGASEQAFNQVEREATTATENEAKAQEDTQRDIEKFEEGFNSAIRKRAQYHAKRHPVPRNKIDAGNGIRIDTQARPDGLGSGSLSSVMRDDLRTSLVIDTCENDDPARLQTYNNKQNNNDDVRATKLVSRSKRHNYNDAKVIAEQIAWLLEMLASLFGFGFNAGGKYDGNRNEACAAIDATKRLNQERVEAATDANRNNQRLRSTCEELEAANRAAEQRNHLLNSADEALKQTLESSLIVNDVVKLDEHDQDYEQDYEHGGHGDMSM